VGPLSIEYKPTAESCGTMPQRPERDLV